MSPSENFLKDALSCICRCCTVNYTRYSGSVIFDFWWSSTHRI